MVEDNECGKCGKKFDSERGLHIHQSRVHEEDEMNFNENDETVEMGLRTAMIGVFALGIFIGVSAGIIFSEMTDSSPEIQQMDEANNPEDKGQDNTVNQDISGESTKEAIADIADSVGADGEQVVSCMEESDRQEINNDRATIDSSAGGIGTPTFFIGNSEIGYTEVSGAQPYSRMRTTIEEKIQEANTGGEVGEEEYTLENVSISDEPNRGKENAPVNIIEYSDFGCPWCAEWHGVDAIPQRPIDQEESFSKVVSNHVDTGEVRFVFKDYPVPQLHPDAMDAHKAANCVLENSPDKYWDFSQKLYEERDKWKS